MKAAAPKERLELGVGAVVESTLRKYGLVKGKGRGRQKKFQVDYLGVYDAVDCTDDAGLSKFVVEQKNSKADSQSQGHRPGAVKSDKGKGKKGKGKDGLEPADAKGKSKGKGKDKGKALGKKGKGNEGETGKGKGGKSAEKGGKGKK